MIEPIQVQAPPSLRQWAQARGYSHEVLARWDRFYPDVLGLVRALDQPAPRYIRTNPLQGPPDETIARLEAKGFKVTAAALEGAWRIQEEPFALGATEEYLMGLYQIMDLSTQLAVPALEPAPGETVVDLAAAPGGKTIHLAQAMENRGAIFAFDPDPERSRALRSNLARCGVRNTAVFVRPGQDAAAMGPVADRVLLDAPCTGEGVIQRDPTRKRIQMQEYEQCAALQGDLLAAATQVLKPGGILLYATCTLAPEENELQVERARDELGMVPEPVPAWMDDLRFGKNALTPGLTSVADMTLDPSMALGRHCLPHLHGCLGFYFARMRKEGGR
jgi:NOL1/NOP2/sun family putative RNA methylase